MARPITVLALLFIAFNLFAAMAGAQGVDTLLGINTEVGGDEQISDVQDQSDEVQTGTTLGNTLFGMYNVLAGGISAVFTTIFPGLAWLKRAGVPDYWISFLGPIFSYITFVGMVSFLRGWGL